MIDPLQTASRIIRDDSLLVEPLLDLLVWASSSEVKESAEFDELMEMLYAKTPDSQEHRAEYLRRRRAA